MKGKQSMEMQHYSTPGKKEQTKIVVDVMQPDLQDSSRALGLSSDVPFDIDNFLRRQEENRQKWADIMQGVADDHKRMHKLSESIDLTHQKQKANQQIQELKAKLTISQQEIKKFQARILVLEHSVKSKEEHSSSLQNLLREEQARQQEDKKKHDGELEKLREAHRQLQQKARLENQEEMNRVTSDYAIQITKKQEEKQRLQDQVQQLSFIKTTTEQKLTAQLKKVEEEQAEVTRLRREKENSQKQIQQLEQTIKQQSKKISNFPTYIEGRQQQNDEKLEKRFSQLKASFQAQLKRQMQRRQIEWKAAISKKKDQFERQSQKYLKQIDENESAIKQRDQKLAKLDSDCRRQKEEMKKDIDRIKVGNKELYRCIKRVWQLMELPGEQDCTAVEGKVQSRLKAINEERVDLNDRLRWPELRQNDLKKQIPRVASYLSRINKSLSSSQFSDNFQEFESREQVLKGMTSELTSLPYNIIVYLNNKGQQLVKTQDELEKSKAKIKENNSTIKRLQSKCKNMSKMESQLFFMGLDLAAAKRQIDRNQVAISDLTKDNKCLETQLGFQKSELAQAQRRQKEADKRLVSVQSQIEEEQVKYDKIEEELQQQLDEKKSAIEQRVKAQEKCRQLESKLQHNKKEYDELQTTYLSKQEESKRAILEMEETGNSKIKNLQQQRYQLQMTFQSEKSEFIQTVCRSLEEAYDQGPVDQTIDGICHLIKEAASSRDTTLSVSPILEHEAKGRKFLMRQMGEFLRVSKFSSTLLYKYDPSAKNFHHFLPSLQNNFNLLLLCHTKQGVIFGVASKGIGRHSRALAFNLKSSQVYLSSENFESSTKYEASMLIVGNGEIKLRNNYGCDIMVNSSIFGARAFKFQKQELVGAGEKGESVQLAAFELHRLDTY